MRTFIALMALVCLTPGFYAHAQFTPKPAPTVTRIKGQNVTAVWPDGREAEFRFARGTAFPLPVPFKVSENLCRPELVGMEFNSQFAMRLDRAGWFWTKHSDTAKVGQILVIPSVAGGNQPLFTFSFVTNSLIFRYPDLAGGVAKDEFIFTDLSWLPGMESGLNDFTIDTWNSEAMVPNLQTGLPENRIVGGATHVTMKKIAPDKLAMESISSLFAHPLSGYSLAMIGDVVTWRWTANGQTCQVSFKPNLGPANTIVQQELSKQGQTFVPYVWGSDSLTKTFAIPIGDETLPYAE